MKDLAQKIKMLHILSIIMWAFQQVWQLAPISLWHLNTPICQRRISQLATVILKVLKTEITKKQYNTNPVRITRTLYILLKSSHTTTLFADTYSSSNADVNVIYFIRNKINKRISPNFFLYFSAWLVAKRIFSPHPHGCSKSVSWGTDILLIIDDKAWSIIGYMILYLLKNSRLNSCVITWTILFCCANWTRICGVQYQHVTLSFQCHCGTVKLVKLNCNPVGP